MEHNNVDYDEDLDNIDFNNYKGFFYRDEPEQRYQDELTGAHFNYLDMCRRLKFIQTQTKKQQEKEEEESAPKEDGTNRRTQTLKQLAELLDSVQPRQSRNAAQALPQQGFATGSNQKIEPLYLKQFSTNEDVGHKSDRIRINADPRKCREDITKLFKLGRLKQGKLGTRKEGPAAISARGKGTANFVPGSIGKNVQRNGKRIATTAKKATKEPILEIKDYVVSRNTIGPVPFNSTNKVYVTANGPVMLPDKKKKPGAVKTRNVLPKHCAIQTYHNGEIESLIAKALSKAGANNPHGGPSKTHVKAGPKSRNSGRIGAATVQLEYGKPTETGLRVGGKYTASLINPVPHTRLPKAHMFSVLIPFKTKKK